MTFHREGFGFVIAAIIIGALRSFVTPLLLSAAIVEELETGLSVLWVAYATHSTLKPVL
jgi:hypothetical protein